MNSIYFAPAAAIVVIDFVRFSVSKAHPCCKICNSDIQENSHSKGSRTVPRIPSSKEHQIVTYGAEKGHCARKEDLPLRFNIEIRRRDQRGIRWIASIGCLRSVSWVSKRWVTQVFEWQRQDAAYPQAQVGLQNCVG